MLMLIRIKSSAREAKDTGSADKFYLCGERVAAALRLTANGGSHHISYRLSSVWGSHKRTQRRWQALSVEKLLFLGFLKNINGIRAKE